MADNSPGAAPVRVDINGLVHLATCMRKRIDAALTVLTDRNLGDDEARENAARILEE